MNNDMTCVFVDNAIPAPNAEGLVPNSIFLAGPTPRKLSVRSWRPEALRILDDLNFKGTVFIPETSCRQWHGDHDLQIQWEWTALSRSACVCFWIPRELEHMPGFTTNVEFGLLMALRPERVVLGIPPHAPKTRYLQRLVTELPQFQNLFGLTSLGLAPTNPVPNLRSCLMLAVAKAGGDDPNRDRSEVL